MTALTLGPIVGGAVWVRTLDVGVVAHQPGIVCPLRPAWWGRIVAADVAAERGCLFCERCWPGLRCLVCAMPSGLMSECGPCMARDIADEVRHERAKEYVR